MKVLIIEDHPKIRRNILKYLKITGYLAEEAINWKEALDKIKTFPNSYDVLILNVNMPIMNGRDFIIELRKMKNQIPVIVLTSNSSINDKLDMFDLWADDYLTKPFDLIWKN